MNLGGQSDEGTTRPTRSALRPRPAPPAARLARQPQLTAVFAAAAGENAV